MKTKQKTIEDLLEKNPNKGLTIQEIAEITGFARNTVVVHLAELRGEGRISIRQIGNAKLHYLIKERK